MFKLCRKEWAIVGFVLCIFSPVFAYSGGSGTQGAPYQIATVQDWNDLTKTLADWNKYFIMTADVNLQGLAATPVGNSSTNFTGVFDGDYYTIYHADINMPTSDNIGLFGRISSAGKVRNLDVIDVNVTGNSYVGGLAGYNAGDINDCVVTGIVTGKSNYVGGLAGRNTLTITDCYEMVTVTAGSSTYVGGLVGNNTGTIKSSYAAGSVSGSSNVGGFIGRDIGTDTNCYARGAVNGSSYVGGFAGYKGGGSIIYSYSTGAVTGTSNIGGFIGYSTGSTVTSSYWDKETSGRTTSAGGTGKTTTEMYDVNTYVGWDFNTPVWKINSGADYPKLAWQVLDGDFVSPQGVNFLDFAYFAQRWLMTNCGETNNCDGTDLNTDGTVDFLDFDIFVGNWLDER